MKKLLKLINNNKIKSKNQINSQNNKNLKSKAKLR